MNKTPIFPSIGKGSCSLILDNFVGFSLSQRNLSRTCYIDGDNTRPTHMKLWVPHKETPHRNRCVAHMYSEHLEKGAGRSDIQVHIRSHRECKTLFWQKTILSFCAGGLTQQWQVFNWLTGDPSSIPRTYVWQLTTQGLQMMDTWV